MEDDLTCSICLDIASDAVETDCCHHIYCHACVGSLDMCPTCRMKLSFKPSIIIRRMIGKMPVRCPNAGCNATTTRSNLSDHKKSCAFEMHHCPAPSCNFKGTRSGYFQHFIQFHPSALLKNAERLFIAMDTNTGNPDVNDQRIETKVNSEGRRARLGSSGKYYCGGRLDGPDCGCCDGDCGPTNGCNCSACMKLDVEARKLPRGWYVNRDGFPCKKGQTPNFYCGRKVMNARNCDGYCGPTDGPNCYACRVLMSQLNTRYDGIW